MPRIPVRVEPYSSPSRQHRHYKNKRDQVLRALGKAAYINGSHFAIMWVSARGDVETYASEALQSRLDDWFVKGGIADEAKQLVKSSGGGVGARMGVFEDLSDDDDDNSGAGELEDVFTDSNKENDSNGIGGGGKKRPLAPLNTAIANQHFLRSRGSLGLIGDDAPKSAPLFPTTTLSSFGGTTTTTNGSDDAPRTSTPLLSSSSRLLSRNSLSSAAAHPFSTAAPTVEITLADEAARTAFLELRFGQLQQGVCKTVAKAWIKIIEPKKQTRCPYNKGEAGKPDWWPSGVRHKEPDHLMKPERHALLLTILRSPKVQVARLQLATAEVVALIKADKVSLLMDVYRIAREEEKLREKGAALDQPVKVGVSTLDGWCSEENGMTSAGRQIARSVTPEMVAEKKKRSGAAMVKSNSTSGTVGANKRRSIAAPASQSAEVKPRPLPAVGLDHHVGQPNHQGHVNGNGQMIGLGLVNGGLGGIGVQRSHSFSAPSSRLYPNPTPSSASTSTDTSPWTNTYAFTEVHGLVTPLTASTALDPAFHPHPQQQHAELLPHHNTFALYPPPPAPVSAGGGGGGANMAPFYAAGGEVHFDNALGLVGAEGWNFDLDMSNVSVPDLSHTSGSGGMWHGGGDNSFSLDSIAPPRTPSPGSNLRLNLNDHAHAAKHDPFHNQHHQQHHQQQPVWMQPDPLSQSTT